jgi:hypothetical protein
MPFRFVLFTTLLAISVVVQTADECKRCGECKFPQPDDTCTKCCFIQKGVIESKSLDSVTITPLPPEPKPVSRKFRLPPHIPITGELKVGEDATVYYHKVDGQDVATRIELTDYIEGQLTPAELPTPVDNECFKMSVPPNATTVLLGQSGAVALRYPFVVLRIDGTDIMTIQKTKKGMLISANLFDSRGHLAAQIVDNHFFINARGAFHIETTPDHHTLKISEGDTTLIDIQFLNPTTVRVLGTLYGPRGTHLDVSPGEMTVNGNRFIGVCAAASRVGFRIAEP